MNASMLRFCRRVDPCADDDDAGQSKATTVPELSTTTVTGPSRQPRPPIAFPVASVR